MNAPPVWSVKPRGPRITAKHSRLATHNVPVLTIKEFAGHVSLEPTRRHLHLAAAALQEVITTLLPFHADLEAVGLDLQRQYENGPCGLARRALRPSQRIQEAFPVPGCPRLESGQGGRKQGRRRCAPGCERRTDEWEVDLALRLPDGTRIRERVKAPVAAKSAALRWAQEREARLLAGEGRKPKPAVEVVQQVPTLTEFKPRFIEGHVKANRLRPSSAQAYADIFRVHLEPVFGSLRLDAIGDERVQRFKGELVEDELASKTINNLLTALSVTLKRAVEWNVIAAMPCRIRLLKVQRSELSFYDFGEHKRLVEGAAAVDPRIELLVLLGGDAGLRRGESPSPWSGATWTSVDGRSTSSEASGTAT